LWLALTSVLYLNLWIPTFLKIHLNLRINLKGNVNERHDVHIGFDYLELRLYEEAKAHTIHQECQKIKTKFKAVKVTKIRQLKLYQAHLMLKFLLTPFLQLLMMAVMMWTTIMLLAVKGK